MSGTCPGGNAPPPASPPGGFGANGVPPDSPDSPPEQEGMEEIGRINMVPFPPQISKCRVKRIAFTGGPCGGQTTALSQVAERLRSMGIQVFVCPEAASIMETAGVSVKSVCGNSPDLAKTWLVNKLQMQMTTESALLRIAEASERTCVILFDRGCIDSAVYCTPESWKSVLATLKLTEKDLYDRYDAVFHLTTTAKGAESFYVPGSQTPQIEAKKLDDRLQEVWKHHPQFTVIDNGRGGMEEKTQHAVSGVCHFLGVHSPMLCKQQYLVDERLVAKMNEKKMKEDLRGYLDEFLVEITFLEGSSPVFNTFLRHRLRRNTEETFSEADSYVKCMREFSTLTPKSPLMWPTSVTPPGLAAIDNGMTADGLPPVSPTTDSDLAFPEVPPSEQWGQGAGQDAAAEVKAAAGADEDRKGGGAAQESSSPRAGSPSSRHKQTRVVSTECLITQREYQHLSSTQAMTNSRTLVINRSCFCYKMQWFQLDYCKQVNLLLLEVECSARDSNVLFPSWLEPCIIRKVSDTPEEVLYQPFRLAVDDHPHSQSEESDTMVTS